MAPSRIEKNRNIDKNGFINQLKMASSAYYDNRKSYEHVLIIAHVDADGYASCELIERMLLRENIPHSYKFFNRNTEWKTYLDNILINYEKYENLAIFLLDLGSEIDELGKYFSKYNIDVYILDHHEVKPYDKLALPENFYIINPTEFGFDGLKEIAGSTICYLFAKNISKKSIRDAWIALIGISNDTLMRIEDYCSFNLEVLEDSISENQVILKNGIVLNGAMHETICNALAYSVFPFIPEFNGDPKKANLFLNKFDIDSNKKVEELTIDEIKKINDNLNKNILGNYIIFPKKNDILRFPFEHGMILSITHYKFHKGVKNLINKESCPMEFKEEYYNYIQELTKNLSYFINTPKLITKHAIFVEADRKMNVNFWSDVATYVTINNLIPNDKILFLGGLDNDQIKLSVRVSEEFLKINNGKGTNYLIQKLKQRFFGFGGGHSLASGYRIAPNNYIKLKKEIDNFFPL